MMHEKSLHMTWYMVRACQWSSCACHCHGWWLIRWAAEPVQSELGDIQVPVSRLLWLWWGRRLRFLPLSPSGCQLLRAARGSAGQGELGVQLERACPCFSDRSSQPPG